MICDEARELCSALVDGALSADERVVLDAHLDGCADCRRELDRLRQTVTLLQGIPPARAPVGFVDRLVAAARPEPWHRRALRAMSLPFRVRLPLEAAALLLVGGLAVYVFQHSPELQQAARNESPPRAAAPDPSAAPAKLADESARTAAPATTPRAPVPTSALPPSASAPTAPPTSGLSASYPATSAESPTSSAPTPEATPAPASAPAAPSSTINPEASVSRGTPPAPRRPAPGAPAPQQAPAGGAKELPAEPVGRAEVRKGASSEVAKTRNAQTSEEDSRRAASARPGEREQKKTAAGADQARDSAQLAAPQTADEPSKAGAPAAAPPAASEPRPPVPSRDEPAARPLARPKAAEPSARARQEIAAGSALARQGRADVAAVVSASDRDTALRALADLVARAQGRELARRPEADGTTVELLIPRAAYAAFAEGLGRLGQVAVPFQAPSLPEEVRVSVRVRP